MYFDMYGPFFINCADRSIIASQKDMWGEVRKMSSSIYGEKELETGIGCYAFGLQNGKNISPWYIGKTVAVGGFRAEIFQIHKLNHYNHVIQNHRGQPLMFLMPLLTPDGRFSRDRGASKPLINWVEKMLFGLALKRNPCCRNQRDTKYLRNVEVRGIFNNRTLGPPTAAVAAARKMFGS